MTRRHFLRNVLKLSTTLIVVQSAQLEWADIDLPLTEPDLTAYGKLYGIPYHVSDASMGQWLGISRVNFIGKELIEMIKLLEQDKSDDKPRG